MTPVTATGWPDYDRLVESAQGLIEAGMSAVVWAGTMGDWSMLRMEQRKEGVERLVRAGIPTIVGTGAQNVFDARELASHAKEVGASGLMVIPRQLSLVSDDEAQERFFAKVLEAAVDLPSVVYNSPYYGFTMQSQMFARLRDKFPHLVGFKEFGGESDLNRDYDTITRDKPELSLVVGLDTKVVHGYTVCGAKAAITGVGNVIPKAVVELLGMCTNYQKNPRERLLQSIERLDRIIRPLAEFDATPQLVLYYKHLMTRQGYKGYDQHIFSEDRLNKDQVELADKRFDTFYEEYSKYLDEESDIY